MRFRPVPIPTWPAYPHVCIYIRFLIDCARAVCVCTHDLLLRWHEHFCNARSDQLSESRILFMQLIQTHGVLRLHNLSHRLTASTVASDGSAQFITSLSATWQCREFTIPGGRENSFPESLWCYNVGHATINRIVTKSCICDVNMQECCLLPFIHNLPA